MIDISPYVNIHTHRSVPDEVSITTAGIHPYDVTKESVNQLCDISWNVEAVGEIGLDYSIDVDRVLQQEVCLAQLAIAESRNLPVVLHCVRAFDAMCNLLEEFHLRAVIFHGFIGSTEQARYAISKGYYLSFGHRCFASPKTLNALRNIHINNVFFETDNEPISIASIYEKASLERSENLEELRNFIYKNYIKIFKNG